MRDRLALRGLGVVARKMRAGDDDGARRGDERLVDVVGFERHVGAVGAVEDHRRDAFLLHRQQHQRRQPVGIGDKAVDRNALAGKLLANEAAHLLVADARKQRRTQAEPGRADGDVGRTAADRLWQRR